MNEINNLIQELCPDGVEYKELAKVLVIKMEKIIKALEAEMYQFMGLAE